MAAVKNHSISIKVLKSSRRVLRAGHAFAFCASLCTEFPRISSFSIPSQPNPTHPIPLVAVKVLSSFSPTDFDLYRVYVTRWPNSSYQTSLS